MPPCARPPADAGIWLLIGSLGLLTQDADGRFANRSFLIAPDGSITARYDKIHMFDVNVSETEVYRESAGYRPGAQAVLADAGWAKIGMTVCYDVRFPHLYRRLAQGGAQIITIPAAFNHITGCRALGNADARPRDRDRLFRAGPGANRLSRRSAMARAAAPMAIRWPSPRGARFWPMPAPIRA